MNKLPRFALLSSNLIEGTMRSRKMFPMFRFCGTHSCDPVNYIVLIGVLEQHWGRKTDHTKLERHLSDSWMETFYIVQTTI